MSKQLVSEFVGTFWLVLAGCGSLVLSTTYAGGTGLGSVGVALAFGITVLTMGYALGAHIRSAF